MDVGGRPHRQRSLTGSLCFAEAAARGRPAATQLSREYCTDRAAAVLTYLGERAN